MAPGLVRDALPALAAPARRRGPARVAHQRHLRAGLLGQPADDRGKDRREVRRKATAREGAGQGRGRGAKARQASRQGRPPARRCARWAPAPPTSRPIRIRKTPAPTWPPGAWSTLSLMFGLALFVGAPHLAAWGIGALAGFDSATFTFHMVDGVIKLALLIGYMAAISLLPDVRRVFQYHGAEHKAIFTYEHGLPLTVENARAQSRFHPALRHLVPAHRDRRVGGAVQRHADLPHRRDAAVRSSDQDRHQGAADVPGGRHWPTSSSSWPAASATPARWPAALSAPGMWLQKITTREPDDSQLEIALISIRKTLWRERADREGVGASDRGRRPRGVRERRRGRAAAGRRLSRSARRLEVPR